jgi:hypothetical protein
MCRFLFAAVQLTAAAFTANFLMAGFVASTPLYMPMLRLKYSY